MVMPGGRHIYLRAASMSERQQWLLAFGVAKQTVLETTDSGNLLSIMVQTTVVGVYYVM